MENYGKIILTSFISILLTACSQAPEDKNESSRYKADITVTEYGIPHIVADDYSSLGFGEGYMAAKDHVCNISYAVMMAKGEVSKYLGAGENDKYLMQDSVTKALDIPARSKTAFKTQPDDLKNLYIGYADGFNKYLQEEPITSWCKDESWLIPITAGDIFNRVQFITQTLPRMAPSLYLSSPPSDIEVSFNDDLLQASAGNSRLEGLGSNAWAIGKDLSEKNRGMLLANPHYPWFGTNRFWEKHLTIPGKLDAYGVSLIGIPGVIIGFNKDIGWSHTVSKSQRVTLYKLKLVEGDPTSYIFDGEERKLYSRDVSVDVLENDGTTSQNNKTIWFSHHGPIITLPGLAWDNSTAYAIRDANRDNISVSAQWLDMSRAGSMDQLKDAHEKWNSMPWVNTVATSSDGQAAYIDNSTVGHLSDNAIALWQGEYENDQLTQKLYDENDMMLLDGSDSRFDFINDGTVPFEQRPTITRSDYVFNSNDNYWLSSPHQPLTGYSPLYGSTETARTLRTRMNIIHIEDPATRGADGKFSLEEIQNTILSNKSLAFEVYKDDLLEICSSVKDACDVISNYDGYLNMDSQGALLFREWLQAYNSITDNSNRHKTAFSVDEPYTTPYGIGDPEKALEALEMARNLLQQSARELNSTLEDTQLAYRGSTIIAIHGGLQSEGVTNMIYRRPNDASMEMVKEARFNSWSELTDKGYLVRSGSSFIMTLEYTDNGPNAKAVLTYGQSGNPEHEHYRDQTQLFSEKKWRNIYFSVDDVRKNALSSFSIESE